MSYKKLTFHGLSLDENLKSNLDYYQEQYMHKVLSESTDPNKKNGDSTPERKKNLKSVLSDFLFAEKYNTVFDIVKLKKKN